MIPNDHQKVFVFFTKRGHQTFKPFGRLNENPDLTCPGCRAVIAIQSGQIGNGITFP